MIQARNSSSQLGFHRKNLTRVLSAIARRQRQARWRGAPTRRRMLSSIPSFSLSNKALVQLWKAIDSAGESSESVKTRAVDSSGAAGRTRSSTKYDAEGRDRTASVIQLAVSLQELMQSIQMSILSADGADHACPRACPRPYLKVYL